MAVTINVNGLSLCHKGSGGVIKNTTPDICKTPPNAIPKPFNITSYSKDLVGGTVSIKVDGGNMAANSASRFSCCTGDEGGSLGGVVSGTFGGVATWISHSPNVYLEGKPACRLTDKMLMNNSNCAGMAGLNQDDLAELRDAMCKVICDANKRRDEYREAKKSPNDPKSKGIIDKAKKDGIVSKNGNFLGDKYASQLADTKYAKQLGKFGLTQKYNSLIKLGTKASSALKEAGKKVLTGTQARDQMVRQMQNKIKRVMATKAAKKAATIWLKAIPFVNVISTIYDVYDIGSTVMELNKALSAARSMPNGDYATAIPDFAKVSENGKIDTIVEMKIGEDKLGKGQAEKYLDAVGGDDKQLMVLDGKDCDCPPAK